MDERSRRYDLLPDFDIVLWGYDRQQVRQCLNDMATRLGEALGELGAVEPLQAELCEARVEVERLRRAAEQDPDTADRLSKIMATAEELRDRAARDAAAIRAQVGATGDRHVAGKLERAEDRQGSSRSGGRKARRNAALRNGGGPASRTSQRRSS
jgi:hypothetical protein